MKRMIFISFLLVLTSSAAYSARSPRISFIEDTYDFGRVLQWKIVEHTFVFQNTGTADLIIKEVTTSCGCTAALLSDNVIRPGEKGEIKVSYDSQGRAIRVTRKIKVVSNDPVEPIKELTIIASVVPSTHTVFSIKDSLFSGKCSKCHAAPAKGKMGKELYDAVCAFCHGKTAVNLETMKGLPVDFIRSTIINGIEGTEMPPWKVDRGGPLNEEQIRSLVSFIKGNE